MRKAEKNYEFRKKLIEIHKKDLHDTTVLKKENEIEITDGFIVDVSCAESDVVLTAAKDFADYMLISMNVSVMISKKKTEKKNRILVNIIGDSVELGMANGYMGYKLCVGEENITIKAYDDRGVAQAFYHLEDLMSLRRAPLLTKGEKERKAMFSPRMVHSGYGLDEFPDCHLRDIAHSGMDAIMVFTEEVNLTPKGFLDFNELIYRASKYGIDVYSYSYLKSEMHPDSEGAESYYDNTYGKLFEACPGLKGVILVGESVAFPSRDPHTSGTISRAGADGIPSTKIHPGWWPCEDYPEWLNMLKKVIRKHNQKADIVFWSYNWGWAPEEDRVKLIHSLPKDISLLVTFEMHEVYEKNGILERTSDYTVSRAMPGKYFLSEAEAAHKNGIKLYSMVNTGGLTWDFGTIPYEPFPYQWQKRHDSIVECHEKYGLSGLMESHHFGFYPSIISELANWNFTLDSNKRENVFDDILISKFGKENLQAVKEALKLWSDAICHYDATAQDQYGPFRIGPSYPICLNKVIAPPAKNYAHFGAGIVAAKYNPFEWLDHSDASVPQLRIRHEISELLKMENLMEQGITLLDSIEKKNDELCELLDLGKYIKCTVRTAINIKEFAVAKVKLDASDDAQEIKKHIDNMEEIALAEIENAKSAIPLTDANSRLGWEPSMEYLGDSEHIRWKIKQVEYMLQAELKILKDGIKNNL